MRARPEPFGAWVRLGDDTLVALNRRGARRIGIDGGPLWASPEDAAPAAPPRPPLEVHLAVTSRCGAGCTGCYLDATPDGESPPFDVIAARLRAVAAAGAFTVAFGGGEPLSRPDLGDLARVAREAGLTPVVTTSGLGMTPPRAASLRPFAQVNVSYDGESDDYIAVRGMDGAPAAERAMRLLAGVGVPFGVNVVLTRETLPRLERTLAAAAALGAREAQLLRYKPAGRARSPGYLAARLTAEQARSLPDLLERLVLAAILPLRIDCALVPLLSARPPDPEALRRFGVLGCEAGRHLAAVRVDGAASPCSFAPLSAPPSAPSSPPAFPPSFPPSFIDVESAWSPPGAAPGWEDDPTFARWRTSPEVEPCRSCPIREVCRGGCKVVALHLDGQIGPDPECPRVVAHRAAAPPPDPLAPEEAPAP